MEKVYDICCGVDVHKKLIVACLRSGKENTIKEFGATTKELLKMSDWLTAEGCKAVAMESTGSYWKPIYNVLESTGMKTMVVNAQHMKAVPGRKTDVKDAEWIADLLQHGLLKESYIPPKEQRELRELTRYRKSLVDDRARELNRLQKMLEGGNIKLSGTVSNINGKSARNIIDYIIAGGEFDQQKFDEMYSKNEISHVLKASREQIIDDMNGVLTVLQKKLMKEVLDHVKELDEHIRHLDEEIDKHMNSDEKQAVEAIKQIPGIGATSAQAVISVIGTDMKRFKTDRHISSWAGLSPGNNESAGKRKSGRTTKGNSLLRSILVVCAHSAVKVKDSFFNAQFMKLASRRGAKRAYVAVAHSILIAIYHVLSSAEKTFHDLGSNYYNQFNREKKAHALLKKLSALGLEVIVKSTQIATA